MYIQVEPYWVARVDIGDYERLAQHRWYGRVDDKTGKVYAWSSKRKEGKTIPIWMHREVLGIEPKDAAEVDHIDPSETLDNRRSNLRIADRSQNNCNRGMRKDNTSGVKGVSRHPVKKDMWVAQIMHQKKAYRLGAYATKELAADAYAEAARRLHGEFARIIR